MNVAKCIMTDAAKGPGIAYWAELKDVVCDSEGNVVGFDVRDNDAEGAREAPEFVRVDENAVRNAISRLLTGEVKVARRIASQFVGGEDNWDYDSEGVDCLIQAVVFGKLVYG